MMRLRSGKRNGSGARARRPLGEQQRRVGRPRPTASACYVGRRRRGRCRRRRPAGRRRPRGRRGAPRRRCPWPARTRRRRRPRRASGPSDGGVAAGCVALRVPTMPTRRPSSDGQVAAHEQHGRWLRVVAQHRRERRHRRAVTASMPTVAQRSAHSSGRRPVADARHAARTSGVEQASRRRMPAELGRRPRRRPPPGRGVRAGSAAGRPSSGRSRRGLRARPTRAPSGDQPRRRRPQAGAQRQRHLDVLDARRRPAGSTSPVAAARGRRSCGRPGGCGGSRARSGGRARSPPAAAPVAVAVSGAYSSSAAPWRPALRRPARSSATHRAPATRAATTALGSPPSGIEQLVDARAAAPPRAGRSDRAADPTAAGRSAGGRCRRTRTTPAARHRTGTGWWPRRAGTVPAGRRGCGRATPGSRPSSSGSRSPSSAAGANSPSSSRNSTPPLARADLAWPQRRRTAADESDGRGGVVRGRGTGAR